MKLVAKVRWQVGGVEIDPRALDMLAAIARRGSLSRAVGDVGLSYRHAWGLLAQYEGLMGQRLVTLQRGRGATLTELGQRLVDTASDCDRELAPELERWAAPFNRKSRRRSAEASNITLRASHDLALAKTRDMLRSRRDITLDLAFAGSLEALRALARYQCDIAGFHIPDSPLRSLMLEPFRPLLADPALVLVHFADREQGLMVARGNPLRIRGIESLARGKAHFVNRQPGSGTRLFFDQLIAASGMRPTDVAGYYSEEFTHAAVAATVASGMADCGFGIEAAARQQKLDFVPVASERYYLAMRRTALQRPGPRALLAFLGTAPFRRMIARLPGYRTPSSAAPVDAHSVFL